MRGAGRDHQRSLENLRRIAHLFDAQFRVPGTEIRFGIDPLIGLVPGIGDLASPFLTMAMIWQATRLRVPKVVLLSSANIYGPRPDNPQFLTEDAPLLGAQRFPQMRDLVEIDHMVSTFLWRAASIEWPSSSDSTRPTMSDSSGSGTHSGRDQAMSEQSRHALIFRRGGLERPGDLGERNRLRQMEGDDGNDHVGLPEQGRVIA